MKKSFIVMMAVMLSVLLVVSASSATMKKGSWFMSGAWELNFSSAGGDLNKNTNGDSRTNINFDPSLGYFIMDGLGIGGILQFAYQKQGDEKLTAWEIGPQGVYYFGANKKDMEKKMVVPFIGAALLYGQSKTEFGSSSLSLSQAAATITYKYNMMDVHLHGGGIYMFTNSWGVFGDVFFELQREKPTGDNAPEGAKWVSGSEFGVQVGVSAFFGK